MIDLKHKNIIDVVKYRAVWLCISALMIIPGIVAMVYSSMTYENHTPLRVGIDFTGGTITQYATEKEVTPDMTSKIRADLEKAGITNPQIQIVDANSTSFGTNSDKKDVKTETANKNIKTMISIRSKFIDAENSDLDTKMTEAVKITVPDATVEQIDAVGPTLGNELLKNSFITMILAFAIIIGYLAIRFQLDYSIIAVVALFHDILIICGIFSILGIFCGTEIDSLFITALLTVIGFSNHDTIVVFDRVRENLKFLSKKASVSEIINASVNQTLARSINTSVTTLLTLLALYFFGGVTTKDFVFAMILGIVVGTYSSIFVAATLLDWHKEKAQKKQGKAVAH